ncbi:protein FAM210B, mitochondrial [Rhea pennata]|uniref:protein FAM210B, mitochondrial n=1 Tax=Rhea pennata TaxID=8795 RepID=UPI002E25AF98
MLRLVRPGPGPPRLAALAALSPPPPPPPPRGCASARPRLGPLPPPPLVALRCAAGSAAKDAGGPPEKAATNPSGENKKPNKSQQLKQVFKEYGAVGVSFHVGISLISLGIFYLAVSSGVDMTAVLVKLGFSESSLQSKMAAGTSTFVLAYAVHKLFAPVRISITVVTVPFIVRYFRKIGFFKPPAPKL